MSMSGVQKLTVCTCPLRDSILHRPANQGKPLLHVGPLKGRHLDDAVQRASPTVVLELGTYLGYSAVRHLKSHIESQ